MTSDFKNLLRRKKLVRLFEIEARELLTIVLAAGDNMKDAIEWVTDDWQITRLRDEIDLLGGFPE